MKQLPFFSTLIVIVLILGACGSPQSTSSVPESTISVTLSKGGDPEKGKAFFTGEGTCSACHTTDTDQLVGPGLAGLFSPEGPTLPNNVDYKGNLPNGEPRSEESIAAWIRSGGQGEIGVMSPHVMSDAQMADLLAYLRTLKK